MKYRNLLIKSKYETFYFILIIFTFCLCIIYIHLIYVNTLVPFSLFHLEIKINKSYTIYLYSVYSVLKWTAVKNILDVIFMTHFLRGILIKVIILNVLIHIYNAIHVFWNRLANQLSKTWLESPKDIKRGTMPPKPKHLNRLNKINKYSWAVPSSVKFSLFGLRFHLCYLNKTLS